MSHFHLQLSIVFIYFFVSHYSLEQSEEILKPIVELLLFPPKSLYRTFFHFDPLFSLIVAPGATLKSMREGVTNALQVCLKNRVVTYTLFLQNQPIFSQYRTYAPLIHHNYGIELSSHMVRIIAS